MAAGWAQLPGQVLGCRWAARITPCQPMEIIVPSHLSAFLACKYSEKPLTVLEIVMVQQKKTKPSINSGMKEPDSTEAVELADL